MKKLLVLMMVVLFLSGFLFARGQEVPGAKEGAVTEALEEKPVIKVQWMVTMFDVTPTTQMPVLGELSKRTNVDIDFLAIPDNEYQTKFNLMLASGEDMPDLIGLNQADAERYGPKGVFVNLKGHEKEMPNFVKWVDKVEGWKNLRTENGDFFGIARIDYPSGLWHALFMRYDILDKNNINIPDTQDDLTAVLRKLKAIYPESDPWTHRFGVGFLLDLLAEWSHSFNGPYFNQERKQFEFGPISEEYKQLIEWLRLMYAEKLLDQSFATNTSEQFYQKLYTGKSFMMCDYGGAGTNCNINGIKNDPDYHMQAIALPKIDGKRGKVMVGDNIFANIQTAISANSKHVARLVEFLDYLYSDEGSILLSWGVKGVTYEDDGKGGFKHTKLIKTGQNPDGTMTERESGKRIGGITQLFLAEVGQAAWHESQQAGNIIYRELDLGRELVPFIRQTDEEKKEISDIEAPLWTFLDENVIGFIIGTKPMSEYDQFIEGLKRLKCERLIEIMNAAYKQQY